MANPKNKKNEEPVSPPAPPAVTESESLAVPPVEEAPAAPDPVVPDAPPVDEPPPDVTPEPPVEEPRAREGFVFLYAPEDVTGCSVDGKEYQADEYGIVEVPSEHVAELVDRGFESAGN